MIDSDIFSVNARYKIRDQESATRNKHLILFWPNIFLADVLPFFAKINSWMYMYYLLLGEVNS